MRADWTPTTSRRGVLLGAAAVGGLSLAGCGGSTTQNHPDSNSNQGGPEHGPRTRAPGEGGAGVVAQTTDIPVGGGKVFADQGVVVTQPTANDFKGFSARCTHAGCTVSKVENGVIVCPCHGSRFSATDGSVKQGPATQPLKPTNITVDAGQIRLLA
ncbi:Rieske (2Fe-2S) protein [Planosporangium thailandense]|uniref:Cytochrome bc1 complex Rieske iron-sulfur subunit n=1 Tax=Planosporangium thailandense TaxID=765197 RepID=A0ABX0XYH3_9ACTN|nr:Rieske (2Fe-2S) protein [Planosporangium thailandense]NJC70942.1 Rieske (2Fe-2S) protein [Planosporangium thailandense]